MHSKLKSKRILVIDDRIPYPHLGSGFPRANSMLQEIHAAGWFITFYPLTFPRVTWPDVYELLPRDVEIMADRGADGLQDFLRERVGYYDAVLVSRPHNMAFFRRASRMVPGFLAGTKLIYDAEAIFAEREAMRCALAGTPLSDAQQRSKIADEIGLADDAAILIVVSERDARTICAESKTPVEVIGHTVAPAPTSAPFDQRSDILFVGALVDDQSPNTDSICWFVREVMPKLDELMGANYRLKVIGRNGSLEVQALASRRVMVLGQADDLRPHYNSSRIFIAPTRFAAGLPMKVHDATAAGVPVVTTRLIAKQLSWNDGVELLAADEAADFAAACHRLYTDRILWGSLRDAAFNRTETECSPAKFACSVAAVLAAIQSDPRTKGDLYRPQKGIGSL